MNIQTYIDQIKQDEQSLYILAAVVIVISIINYIFILRKLRQRAQERLEREKAQRVALFQQSIAEDAQIRENEKLALREELLGMDEEAFRRYKKQRGYTYQHYLDVAFNKDDDPEHRFLYEIEERRKLHHFLDLQKRLETAVETFSDEALLDIEHKYPYGITFTMKENPTETDILKNSIGEHAAAELRKRGKLQ